MLNHDVKSNSRSTQPNPKPKQAAQRPFRHFGFTRYPGLISGCSRLPLAELNVLWKSVNRAPSPATSRNALFIYQRCYDSCPGSGIDVVFPAGNSGYGFRSSKKQYCNTCKGVTIPTLDPDLEQDVLQPLGDSDPYLDQFKSGAHQRHRIQWRGGIKRHLEMNELSKVL